MKKKNPEYVKRGKKGISTIRQKAGDARLSLSPQTLNVSDDRPASIR